MSAWYDYLFLSEARSDNLLHQLSDSIHNSMAKERGRGARVQRLRTLLQTTQSEFALILEQIINH